MFHQIWVEISKFEIATLIPIYILNILCKVDKLTLRHGATLCPVRVATRPEHIMGASMKNVYHGVWRVHFSYDNRIGLSDIIASEAKLDSASLNLTGKIFLKK